MKLPEGFVIMMEKALGSEASDFFAAMDEPPSVSVRLNSRKPTDAFDGCKPVAWCRQGRYLPERPVFTLDPLLHCGAYYVQDASSMILHYITSVIVGTLSHETGVDPLPLSVADFCAAPGGKATAILDALPDGSRMVANEFVAKRAGALRENLTKWGVPGVTVTNHAVSYFAQNGDLFDFVNVDAPCSGEGMMRKDNDALAQWSEELVAKCASLQREILTDAARTVRPGGFLVYSTCTFNTIENEQNAKFIQEELGMVPFDPKFPADWGIPGGIGTDLPVARFMPHKTKGEGLFLSVFRRPGVFSPSVMTKKTSLQPVARLIKGKNQRKTPIETPPPSIEDILSVDYDRNKYPLAELTLEEARSYLRRESVTLDESIPKGYAVVTYKGIPLGPVKNIGQRANNLYPKNWRILMR